MDGKSPSSGDILRSLEPAIDRVENLLRKAAGGQGGAQFAFAIRSVGLLRTLLQKIIDQVADQDLAERAIVYYVVAERCSRFLDRSVDAVFPAVLRLCGESDANLTGSVPSPDPEIVSLLEKFVLRVDVTYSFKGERAEREVLVLLHDAHERQIREQKVTEDMPWEQLPEDVRERFVRDSHQPVAFTLYQGGK
jgi:hypothetical protein